MTIKVTHIIADFRTMPTFIGTTCITMTTR
jgi:hypothetical protein